MAILSFKTQTAKKGFTLIEVLAFVTIASFLLITVMAVTVISINRMKSDQYKLWGNYFTESLLEWLTGEREADWNAFYAKAGDVTDNIYCFNDINLSSWPSTGNCTNYSLGANEIFGGKQIFKREAYLRQSGTDKVNVKVVVTWKEKSGERKIEAIRNFSFVEE